MLSQHLLGRLSFEAEMEAFLVVVLEVCRKCTADLVSLSDELIEALLLYRASDCAKTDPVMGLLF